MAGARPNFGQSTRKTVDGTGNSAMADHRFDLVLRGGTVVDGSCAAPYVADVGIRDGLIAEIGTGLAPGAEEIDAAGKLVTPGFVDIH
ncbi:MAG: hypothetical protein EBS42_01855, partial [Caulobacteraceae bacterium]|nr:hypothetical protein [Caulobacteraceae bacterium]